jgi:hypothetical protein
MRFLGTGRSGCNSREVPSRFENTLERAQSFQRAVGAILIDY